MNRTHEQIIRAEADKQFKRDQRNAARLIQKELGKSGIFNQLNSKRLANVRDDALLDSNHMLARLAHEVLCLRRRMNERDREILAITKAVKLRGKPARAKDAKGIDRSVIELRRIARKLKRARSRVIAEV